MKFLCGRDSLKRKVDAAFRHHDELAGGAGRAILDNRRGGPDEIRVPQNSFRAFGVRDDDRIREGGLGVQQTAHGKRLVHDTSALPDFHVRAAGLPLDVIAEIAVGQE